jgi:hypothetical protein
MSKKQRDVKPADAKPAKTPLHRETKLDRKRAVEIAIYTMLVFGVATLLLLAIWPRTHDELALNATRSITIVGFGAVAMGPEILIATTMVLAGVVGACVYSLYAISLHLGAYKDFDKAWTWWYILRPIIGAGLAFIVYVLIRGGILTIGAEPKNLNFLGLTGISALVGLFTEHSMNKLRELADTAFGATPDEASKVSKEKVRGT